MLWVQAFGKGDGVEQEVGGQDKGHTSRAFRAAAYRLIGPASEATLLALLTKSATTALGKTGGSASCHAHHVILVLKATFVLQK